MNLSERARKEFRAIGQKFGASGGKKAAKNMSPEERKARASKAGKAGAKARWSRVKSDSEKPA